MSGVGVQKAGATSAGYGTSPAATEFGGGFLRDSTNGRSLGARMIDSKSRDYVRDENGRTLGRSSVRAAVQYCISTERGSAADTTIGHRLKTLKRISPNFERAVDSVLRDAVAPLVQRGLIEVIAFREYRKGDGTNGLPRGAIYGRFEWRDLTTRQVFEEGV